MVICEQQTKHKTLLVGDASGREPGLQPEQPVQPAGCGALTYRNRAAKSYTLALVLPPSCV
jgi:hypothetical protein